MIYLYEKGDVNVMACEKQDRRSLRTRQMIFESMLVLLRKKQYSSITVQDIIKEANIGRSTFYSHFETKEDLISSYLDILFNHLDMQINNLGEEQEFLGAMTHLLCHIYEQKKMIKGLMDSEIYVLIFDKISNHWGVKLVEYVRNKKPDYFTELPYELHLMQVTETLITLLRWCITQKDTINAEEMNRYLKVLIAIV